MHICTHELWKNKMKEFYSKWQPNARVNGLTYFPYSLIPQCSIVRSTMLGPFGWWVHSPYPFDLWSLSCTIFNEYQSGLFSSNHKVKIFLLLSSWFLWWQNVCSWKICYLTVDGMHRYLYVLFPFPAYEWLEEEANSFSHLWPKISKRNRFCQHKL